MNAIRSALAGVPLRTVLAAAMVSVLTLASPARALTGQGSITGSTHATLPDMSEEEMRVLIERFVSHIALEIDATAEQRQRMVTELSSIARELRPVYLRMRDAGARFEQLLLAETVDRAELEKLRAEHIAEADRVSRIVVDGLAGIAEVLDIEQRQALRDLAGRFAALRHGFSAE